MEVLTGLRLHSLSKFRFWARAQEPLKQNGAFLPTVPLPTALHRPHSYLPYSYLP